MKQRLWLLFSACFLLAACATVQYTGRHQFNLVSKNDEMKLGDDSYADVLKKNPITNNAEYQRRVQEVGKRIKVAANEPDYQWEFNVLQGKDVNAFCLPGGKVAFWEA